MRDNDMKTKKVHADGNKHCPEKVETICPAVQAVGRLVWTGSELEKKFAIQQFQLSEF